MTYFCKQSEKFIAVGKDDPDATFEMIEGNHLQDRIRRHDGDRTEQRDQVAIDDDYWYWHNDDKGFYVGKRNKAKVFGDRYDEADAWMKNELSEE